VKEEEWFDLNLNKKDPLPCIQEEMDKHFELVDQIEAMVIE
jgi:hypothetical protein